MKNKHNYKSIYQEVKSTILDQTYPTNTLLPTETTLAENTMFQGPRLPRCTANCKKKDWCIKAKAKEQ